MLIFSETSSTRLQYICHFIFREQLGIGYSLTIDSESFAKHDGPKINYSYVPIEGNVFTLKPTKILFEKTVVPQPIDCFEYNGGKAFFKTEGHFDFDIFAASFYLLSRYEEYLPHTKDMYGRFAHENAIAFKEGFLNKPVINNWIQDLANAIQQKFPGFQPKLTAFSFIPTYDIDIAWSFKNKGLIRNVGGFLKSPSFNRLAVLAGMQKDPFDCYEYLDELHRNYQLNPIYFFLVATSTGLYDKNISPYEHAMWQLMKRHSKKYAVGIHPSWRSNEKPALFEKEKKILETIKNGAVKLSRQHYIKMSLPDTYQNLYAAGITDEYSMGYGSINGFRASVASSFFWYNLKEEAVTKLRIHPFCFMDANAFYEQKQTAQQSLAEIMHYYHECKNANGQMITIFHNSFLGTDPLYKGWRKMYDEFTSQVRL
ncbi:MAG TPA: polysaccharide deacetylase family protein [Ferruginibacter sp.]|nr:polysaccharide deacetylase family protein [Ferruginibacter sp.]